MGALKIYVASSWRNYAQPAVVAWLESNEHEVYDFKNPRPGDNGFHWSEIDPTWGDWSNSDYLTALDHPIAEAGFASDLAAMEWADLCVLVLPCGRSAHLELGWFAGRGKPCAIYSPAPLEPELMVKMCDLVTDDLHALRDWVDCVEAELWGKAGATET